MNKLISKVLNWETISYIVVGVLTTLVDWAVYAILWKQGVDYRISTALSWAAAVLFAYVTNKFFVFRSFSLVPKVVWKEFSAFVACRVLTGILTMVGMIVLVSGLGLHELIGKVFVSAMSLILNYVGSKLFIFRKADTQKEEK